MSVDDAREQYALVADALLRAQGGNCGVWTQLCPVCHWLGREIEAASLTLDLAVAEASRQRTRESVAW